MKTMKCKDLGGPAACEVEIKGSTWEEMAENAQNHGHEASADPAHAEAMGKIAQIMMTPGALDTWMEEKKKLFDETPED